MGPKLVSNEGIVVTDPMVPVSSLDMVSKKKKTTTKISAQAQTHPRSIATNEVMILALIYRGCALKGFHILAIVIDAECRVSKPADLSRFRMSRANQQISYHPCRVKVVY